MSTPSIALEPYRLQTARTSRYDRSPLTSGNNLTDGQDFTPPPLTLPAEPESPHYTFQSLAEAENISPPSLSPSALAENDSISKKTTLIPIANSSLTPESSLPEKEDSAIKDLRSNFEKSLNQTLEHLKQYLLAAVEAQVKASIKTSELPAPQEFLAQVRDIVQAAVSPHNFHTPNLASLGSLKPLPKLSFLQRPYGKWAEPSQGPTSDKIPPPASRTLAPSTILETSKVETQPTAKPSPFIANPIPSPTDKLPWETQNPFL